MTLKNDWSTKYAKSYDIYVNYKKTVNAQEAVAAFLWATGIVEKPGK